MIGAPCPGCGAAIGLPSDVRFATCEHCGARLARDGAHLGLAVGLTQMEAEVAIVGLERQAVGLDEQQHALDRALKAIPGDDWWLIGVIAIGAIIAGARGADLAIVAGAIALGVMIAVGTALRSRARAMQREQVRRERDAVAEHLRSVRRRIDDLRAGRVGELDDATASVVAADHRSASALADALREAAERERLALVAEDALLRSLVGGGLPAAIVVGSPVVVLAAFAGLADVPWPARVLAGGAALVPAGFAWFAQRHERAWLIAHAERVADNARRRERAAAAEQA